MDIDVESISSSSLCPYRRICRNPISSYKALSQLDSCHPIMWHPITLSWASRMCVAARRLLCVEEEVLSQLVASTVTSSVLCGETFYMGGVVKLLCYGVLVWKQNDSAPSLSEPGRRGVGACSMSSSVQELYLIEGVGDCNEWKKTHDCSTSTSTEACCVANSI